MSKSNERKLFNQLNKLLTEQRNPNTENIDTADSDEIVRLINREDRKVADAVSGRSKEIARAIDIITESFKKGGRLLYFGAGTSGRLGVLDASECPPTFGSAPEKVQGFIAGGEAAMFRAQEGAEDNPEYGRADVQKINVTKDDVVVGIAASGRTPYVHGAVQEGNERGAKTIFITTVSADQISLETGVDVMIDVPVGPEVVMGSTRMKSATAQKMILNMLSTGAMIRLGKVYENVMVDLQMTNEKLRERSKRIVMMMTDCSYEQAVESLEKAAGHVKTAIVMLLLGCEADEAQKLLDEHDGFIRKAIQKD